MKAIVWTNYGPPEVLRLQEIEKPTPKDKEVLIRVLVATVTAGDCETRSLKFPLWIALPMRLYLGMTQPRGNAVLGQELAGEVEAVGKDVTQFKAGDLVFAAAVLRSGAYTEYVCLPEANVMSKPANVSDEEAATIPTGGINGLHFVRKAAVQAGENILINGAGGSIGTVALQIAKSMGAQVTCVDSAAKLDVLRSLGADHVIDYAREDFTKSGKTYDVIIDVVGKSAFADSIAVLKPKGRYVLGNLTLGGIFRGLVMSRTTGKQVIFELARHTPEDFAYLKGLIEAGTLKVIIDRRYPLAQTAAAHRYVDSGQKIGNVIITVAPPDSSAS